MRKKFRSLVIGIRKTFITVDMILTQDQHEIIGVTSNEIDEN